MISGGAAQPRRGEIWLVDLNPTVGDEIKKERPCLIVNSDSVGRLRLRLVAPVTGWKDSFKNNLWHVRIEPDKNNGLTKASVIDVLQLRGTDIQRFKRKLGHVSAVQMEEVAAAIAVVVEHR